MYSEALVEPIAQVFSNLGVRKVMFSTAWTAWTKVTLTTTTKVCGN